MKKQMLGLAAVVLAVGFSAFTAKTSDTEFGLVSRVLQSGSTFRYTVANLNLGTCAADGYACKALIDPSNSAVTTVSAGSIYDIDESSYIPSTEGTDGQHFEQ